MWKLFLLEIAPLIVSVVSLVVHFFVFHRLKCTKKLSDCVRSCLPILRDQRLNQDVHPVSFSDVCSRPRDPLADKEEKIDWRSRDEILSILMANLLSKGGDHVDNS